MAGRPFSPGRVALHGHRAPRGPGGLLASGEVDELISTLLRADGHARGSLSDTVDSGTERTPGKLAPL